MVYIEPELCEDCRKIVEDKHKRSQDAGFMEKETETNLKTLVKNEEVERHVSTEVYWVQRYSPDIPYGWRDGVKKETLDEAISFRDICHNKTRIIKRIEIVIEC